MSFRNGKTYNELRDRFEADLEGVWPNCFKAQECFQFSNKKEPIEKLMLSSYRLMKHIREWLKKKRLDYNEGYPFPSLFTALEKTAAYFVVKGHDSLAVEAYILESISRSCYAWMKKHKWVQGNRYSGFGCQCCKTKPALASTSLCEDCGKEDEEPPPNVVSSGPFSEADKEFPLPGGDMLITRRNLIT